MEQDPTFMASDDTSTIDNDAEGNITIGYTAAAATTGASAPTTTTTSAPEAKSEAQVQRREPSEYPRENTISASAGKPKYYKNYQFKLNLPTVVDVCSVIQIFKRARTKEVVPTDNNTGCRHIIEKTQSESIHGVQLCTKRVETREKVYPIEECLKRSRKSTYEMTYNGCVLCGKQHFSLYCPEM